MVGKQSPEWLGTDWLLIQFSVQRKRAIVKYIEFVRKEEGQESIWENLNQQIFMGDENF